MPIKAKMFRCATCGTFIYREKIPRWSCFTCEENGMKPHLELFELDYPPPEEWKAEKKALAVAWRRHDTSIVRKKLG